MNKLMNPDYNKFYQLYKKLPGIAAISIMAVFALWSILDVALFSSRYYRGYGILKVGSPIISILIWILAGVIIAGIVWFFSALTTSATVTRTDAVLKIAEATEEKTEIKE